MQNALMVLLHMQISLARAPGVAYTTLLIVFLGIGLLITTTLRVKGNMGNAFACGVSLQPLASVKAARISMASVWHVAGVGIMSNLGLGIMTTLGQFVWPAHPLWADVRLLAVALSL